MPIALKIINAQTATFECTFGRGCEGLCCKNGRPSVTPEEQKTIQKVLKRALPLLRPKARQLIEKEGFLSRRKKLGQPMLRVQQEYCVFFNEGCILHKIGAEDGKAYQYKPVQCALFPLEPVEGSDDYYIRQWNVEGEQWDLFCLNPKNSKKKAVDTLAEEIELAEHLRAKKKRKAT